MTSDSTTRSSAAAADRSEPRAARTRARVLEAVRSIAEAGELPGLTVAALCRRADVHRVTFYKHWTNLDDAVADTLTELVDSIAAVPETAIADRSGQADLATLYTEALTAQLEELRTRRNIYRELFDAPTGSFRARLEAALLVRSRLAVAALARVGVDVRGVELAAAYLAGGVAASFVAFVHSEDVDVGEAAAEITAQLPPWWPRPQGD